ncbi:SDR family NAD(P)-dependent oxidoreductase [Leucobacter chromiireducens]|uniref:SDR family NAD(P)-dependent oxidoreductase n=1 Tax=Leucobacter chromiireducens TaxID=283877 RepID=UPI000F63E27F|nr:SDR family oxidoreductase [Leucobacter chromiireducens]
MSTIARPRPVALITGGAAGLGLACAERWVSQGGAVVLADRAAEPLRGAIARLGARVARGVVCDVTDTDSIDAAVASVRAVEARLDTVINSAGIARPEASDRISDSAFSALLDIHVTGTMRVCRAAYPALRDTRGNIVNVASVAAFAGMPGRAAYTAAKAAVTGLTRTLAVEWAASGVRVNAIAPGYVRTALTDQLIERGELNPAPILARTPQGRFAEPHEIAAAVQFLASPDASFVTGHTLLADGGLTVDGDWY